MLRGRLYFTVGRAEEHENVVVVVARSENGSRSFAGLDPRSGEADARANRGTPYKQVSVLVVARGSRSETPAGGPAVWLARQPSPRALLVVWGLDLRPALPPCWASCHRAVIYDRRSGAPRCQARP